MKNISVLLFLLLLSMTCSALDPHLSWAKLIGAGGYDCGTHIATDDSGNVYAVGFFIDTADFDPGMSGGKLKSNGGNYDVFLSKMSPSGSLLWVKQLGGINGDRATGITVTPSGFLYIVGAFSDTVDFDPGPGVFLMKAPPLENPCNSFICKLTTDGDFVWARSINGEPNWINRVSIDSNENAYITGFFTGTVNAKAGFPGYELISNGSMDAFIAKIDATGDWNWIRQVGGFFEDFGNNIDVDRSGNVVVTGSFAGTVDFDPDTSVFLMTAEYIDAYTLKLTNEGAFVWAYRLGGKLTDAGTGVRIGRDNSIYLRLYFMDTVDLDPGPATLTVVSKVGYSDAVLKLDSNGALIWAKTILGGVTGDDISLDKDQNIYMTGVWAGTADFDPGPGSFTRTTTGWGGAAYLLKLDSLGNFCYHREITALDSPDKAWGKGLALDNRGGIYITGLLEGSADVDPDTGTYMLTAANYDVNILLVKLEERLIATQIPEIASSEIAVFPNPSNGIIYVNAIDFERNIEIKVYNSSGRVVAKQSCIPGAKPVVDLSAEPSGVYLLEFGNRNVYAMKRIVKY